MSACHMFTVVVVGIAYPDLTGDAQELLLSHAIGVVLGDSAVEDGSRFLVVARLVLVVVVGVGVWLILQP